MTHRTAPTLDTACSMVANLLTIVLACFASAAIANNIVSFQLPFDQFGHLANSPDGRCAATSTINSFQYLTNVFGADLVPGAGTDLETARDALEEGWIFNDEFHPGMQAHCGDAGAFQRIWESKINWIEDFGQQGLRFLFDGMLFLPGTDLSTWMLGSVLTNAFPTWDFIYGEVTHGEDVEIAFDGIDVNGVTISHAVTLTGVAFRDLNTNSMFDFGEPQFIDYLDPNNPLVRLEAPLTLDPDGSLRFSWDNGNNDRVDSARIYYALSESVPEPGTLFLLLLAGALLSATLAVRGRQDVRP